MAEKRKFYEDGDGHVILSIGFRAGIAPDC